MFLNSRISCIPACAIPKSLLPQGYLHSNPAKTQMLVFVITSATTQKLGCPPICEIQSLKTDGKRGIIHIRRLYLFCLNNNPYINDVGKSIL
jgi:hypothetical protein